MHHRLTGIKHRRDTAPHDRHTNMISSLVNKDHLLNNRQLASNLPRHHPPTALPIQHTMAHLTILPPPPMNVSLVTADLKSNAPIKMVANANLTSLQSSRITGCSRERVSAALGVVTLSFTWTRFLCGVGLLEMGMRLAVMMAITMVAAVGTAAVVIAAAVMATVVRPVVIAVALVAKDVTADADVNGIPDSGQPCFSLGNRIVAGDNGRTKYKAIV